MADNTTLNLGSGGDVIATDDIAGVKHQQVKLEFGADGTATPVSAANPLPTVQTGALPAGTNNIGDVDVLTLPNVTLAAGTNTNEVVGDAAIDAAIAGNPVLIGGRASTAVPTAMSADNDAQAVWLTRNGAPNVVIRDLAGDSAMDETNNAVRATIVSGSIAGIVDDAAFTAGTSEVLPVGFFADETATDSVDEGDAGAARMTLDRKQIITTYAHAAAGGCTPYKNIDVDETEDEIKGTPGKLFWVHVMNLHASSARYIKFYNATAANVVVGTTVPVLTYPIPSNVNGFTIGFGPQGTQFDTAITVAATTGLADNDTGAPGANEVVLNAGYL